jgi:CRISPR-associated protein Cmr6
MMMTDHYLDARRERFVFDKTRSPHLGLLLERGADRIKFDRKKFEESDLFKGSEHVKTLDEKVAKPNSSLIEQVCDVGSSGEKPFSGLEAWKADLDAIGAVCKPATVQGRMVVGLGNESVLETNISVHRTYGVPFIPGSALKGLVSSYAHQRLEGWQEGSDAHRIMFGDTSNAGYVTFYDALPQTWALHQDVITVHHSGYYSGELDKDSKKLLPPADWDDPIPISFISASGTFLIALAGPEVWVARAFGILEKALLEMCVGAKTSSGYGRLILKP